MGILEKAKLSKIEYLVEKLEKRNLNEKIKTFKKLEKIKITKNIGLYLINNSTRNFEVIDEFGGINSSLIELCFKEYYEEYADAIENIFKDLSNEAQDRVLYLLTTRSDKRSLELYADLVLKYYKKRKNVPIGELPQKPLSYPYLFPKLYKTLKFNIHKNNIIILLNSYLNAGVVLKDDIKDNKKLIIDNLCILFDDALKYKFKNTYDGLNNLEYKNLRYFLELAINIEYYVSNKKTKDYLSKLLKKNDNQLKLFILDNYIRKDQKLTKFNFDPILKDKASRYALVEFLTIYNKLDLLSKKQQDLKMIAQSDLYTNFVIATSYTNEPKNIRYYKKYTKDNYDYYVFKFDYEYKYNNVPNDYLTNYICNQLGIDKHIGDNVKSKFIGISGGYNKDVNFSIVEKKLSKLLIEKIGTDTNIDEVVEKLLDSEDKIELQDEIKPKKEKKIKIRKEKKEKIKKEKKSHFKKKKEKNIIDTEEIKNELEIVKRKSHNIFSYILLFLFTVFLGLLIYCMLYIYGVGSLNDGIDQEIIKPAKLQDKGNFTEILGTEIFNQTEEEYFVLLFKGAKKEKTKYYRYINEYNKRNFRFYFVDLKNNENKFLYEPNGLDFTLSTDRLLKVKDKEFEYYVDGKTNILNEMQSQIEEILRQEREAKKQALMEEKRQKLGDIALSSVNNKKDKRPVNRLLKKEIKKGEMNNRYSPMLSKSDIDLDLNKSLVYIRENSIEEEYIEIFFCLKPEENNAKKRTTSLAYNLKENNNIDFHVIKVAKNNNCISEENKSIRTLASNKKDASNISKMSKSIKNRIYQLNISNKLSLK